jgi:mRNA interferase MazF
MHQDAVFSSYDAPVSDEATSAARRVRRGELFWVTTTERGSALAHPHVVVQDDLFNRSRVHSVIVCALSSNLHRATEPGNVLLDPGEGGLPKQSVVVVSQIDAVPRERLGERIGVLSEARVEQILDGLGFQQRAFLGER